MLESLMKKSRKQNLSWLCMGIVLTIICVIAICHFNIPTAFYNVITGVPYFEIHEGEENIEREYVEYSTYYLDDYFAHYGFFTSITSLELPTRLYGIFVYSEESDTPKLMAIEVPFTKFKKADRLVEAMYSEEQINIEDMEVYTAKGSVQELKEEAREYFYDFYGDYESMGVELLPYVLQDGRVSGVTFLKQIGLVLLALALFIATIIYLKALINCSNIGYITDKFATKYKEINFNDAVMDCEQGTCISDVYIGNEFIAFTDLAPEIIRLTDIAWFFGKIKKGHKKYLKESTDVELIIKTIDKDRFCHTIKAYYIEPILEELSEKAPHIRLGYSEALAKAYITDIAEFMKMDNPLTGENSDGIAEVSTIV